MLTPQLLSRLLYPGGQLLLHQDGALQLDEVQEHPVATEHCVAVRAADLPHLDLADEVLDPRFGGGDLPVGLALAAPRRRPAALLGVLGSCHQQWVCGGSTFAVYDEPSRLVAAHRLI
jgi:hypothetical protein